MAADIQQIILTREQLNSIAKLQVDLEKRDIHFFEHPEDLRSADERIERKLSQPERTSRIGIAIPNVSFKQGISITDDLIRSCNEKLKQMQNELKALLKCLDLKPIAPKKITECCEDFSWNYRYFDLNFNLLLEVIDTDIELMLSVADLTLLTQKISKIQNFYAKRTDVLTSSMDEGIFSMDRDDDSSDSPALSTPDSHPQKPEGSDKKERRTAVYTPFSSRGTIPETSSSKVALPKSSLSVQHLDSASPKKEKPQDAISLLSEMLRKAEYLCDKISLLCGWYDHFDRSTEENKNDHYKDAKSKLAELSSLIRILEENLKIRTAGHIRHEDDFSDYKKALQSTVKGMKNIIQNDVLKEAIDFIYAFILSKTEKHNAKSTRFHNKIYYSAYINRIAELNDLCTEIGKADGVVRLDMARIEKEIKRKIIIDDVFAAELEGVFAAKLEMKSTLSHSAPSNYEKSESSSQFPSSQGSTHDRKKLKEKDVAAYSDPSPSTEQKLSPLTFFKERPEERFAFRSELKISSSEEQIQNNLQEEQKDKVNCDQNTSGQDGLIHRRIYSQIK